jgi:putative membrane protein insertion efficiency factor
MLDLYRAIMSPLITAVLGDACRFHPSCSVYARQAIAEYGLGRGGWLAMRRLLRCRPWGGWGEDPVPARDRVASA